jgi:hypothetical protein
MTFEVRSEERAKARSGDYSWLLDHYALACHFGVWDEGHNFDKTARHAVIARTDRHRFCFFWSHRPGMLLPAAEVLQKREAEQQEARHDRKLTIIGLWIAAMALVVNLLVELADRFGIWPFKP